MRPAKACDVVVVGGGIAGLIAARELSQRGLHVCLCEASSRLGGRMMTVSYGGRDDVELGATWVHWTHPHLWAEMTRYGLEYVPDPRPEVALVRDGSQYRAVPYDEDESVLMGLLTKLLGGTESAFPNPQRATPHSPELGALDGLSIADRLGQLTLTDRERDWADSYLPALTGETNEDAGLGTFAHWWSCAGGVARAFLSMFEGGRIAGGTTQLVDAVSRDIRGEILMSAPVTKIEHAAGQSQVTLGTAEIIQARHVILAAPINTWKSIEFEPPLAGAAHRASLAESGGAKGGHKLIIHVAGDAPGFQAIMPPDEALNLVFTFTKVPGGQLLGAYTRIAPEAPSQAAVEAALKKLNPDLALVSIRTHEWTHDPYFQGAWTYRRPHEMSRDLDISTATQPGLSFAGADVSSGLNWMDGAIASGLAGARSLLETDAKS
ncbi:MAG: FAD-dependent oxidoreductase [Pseudonocardiaceae bacterium]|nr:FAD-dependent oxidoreductase [Pseudonocardiaceae bacterium]